MPWDRPDQWDRTTLTTYADLARLRRAHPSLRRGGLRWAHVDADTIAFVRELEGESVLVVARRSAGPGFTLPLGSGTHVLGSEPGGVDLAAVVGGVEVPAADGPRVDVWELGTE
jgi:alpha-glucosidase